MDTRKAIHSDAENLAALAICVWVDTYATYGVFDAISKYVFCELTVDKMTALIESKDVFVIQGENSLLGYIVLNAEKETKVEIETLYVLPGFQGKGLGTFLIEKAIDFVNAPVWLSVWDKNRKAINFYQRFGFEERGELYFDLYGIEIRNIVLELNS